MFKQIFLLSTILILPSVLTSNSLSGTREGSQTTTSVKIISFETNQQVEDAFVYITPTDNKGEDKKFEYKSCTIESTNFPLPTFRNTRPIPKAHVCKDGSSYKVLNPKTLTADPSLYCRETGVLLKVYRNDEKNDWYYVVIDPSLPRPYRENYQEGHLIEMKLDGNKKKVIYDIATNDYVGLGYDGVVLKKCNMKTKKAVKNFVIDIEGKNQNLEDYTEEQKNWNGYYFVYKTQVKLIPCFKNDKKVCTNSFIDFMNEPSELFFRIAQNVPIQMMKWVNI